MSLHHKYLYKFFCQSIWQIFYNLSQQFDVLVARKEKIGNISRMFSEQSNCCLDLSDLVKFFGCQSHTLMAQQL